MADKSVPQLTAKTESASGDLYHMVRSNVDYKIDFDDLQASILGGAIGTGETTYQASLVITTAQVLALNATPLLLIAAPAAGTYIQIISSAAKIAFNSAAYATYTTLNIYTDTANKVQHTIAAALAATVTRIGAGAQQITTAATDTQLISAKGVYVNALTGDPVTGDSDVTIYVTYRIVTE